jgi:hypothetical protein
LRSKLVRDKNLGLSGLIFFHTVATDRRRKGVCQGNGSYGMFVTELRIGQTISLDSTLTFNSEENFMMGGLLWNQR